MTATVKLLFGASILLVLLNMVAAILIARFGMVYADLLMVSLLLTGAFAVIGMILMPILVRRMPGAKGRRRA